MIPEISNAASTNNAGVRSKSASNEPHLTQNLTSPSVPRRNQGEKCPVHLIPNEEEVVAREQAEHVNLQNAVSIKPSYQEGVARFFILGAPRDIIQVVYIKD